MGAKVGVALVGHGQTASQLLMAARGIVGGDALDDVIAIDAGAGETPEFNAAVCEVLDTIDRGRGAVVVVDLVGASPCQCAQRQGSGRELTVLSGLNLAMLLKLAGIDRCRLSPAEIAEACAEAGTRAVRVTVGAPPSKEPSSRSI